MVDSKNSETVHLSFYSESVLTQLTYKSLETADNFSNSERWLDNQKKQQKTYKL